MNTTESNNLIAGYRHYERVDGWLNLWNADECEKCGEDCIGPNSIKVAGRGLGHLLARHKLTERASSDTAGELGYSDEFGGAVCPACYDEELKEARRHEHYEWTVKITVDPIWVADGFDLDQDRLMDILSRELGYARCHEYGGEVLTTPDADEIRAEQSGRKVGKFEPRIPDDC